MLTTSSESGVRVDSAAMTRVSDWCGVKLREHARAEIGSFAFKLLGALLVTGVIYTLMFALFARAITSSLIMFSSGVSVLLALCVPVVIGCIVQAFIFRREHGHTQVHGQRVAYRDHHSVLGDPNDDSHHAWWRVPLLPAWLIFSAFESLLVCRHLLRADKNICGEILAGLAAADRRIHIPDLETRFGQELVPAMRALVNFPGVIVSQREYPSLMLSSELGDEIRSML